MKIEPRELLNVVADAVTELVNENPDMSGEVLEAMKLMTQKIKDKLFIIEVSDCGLSKEDISMFMNQSGGNANA